MIAPSGGFRATLHPFEEPRRELAGAGPSHLTFFAGGAGLREAFAATFKDPQFLAECAKLSIECSDSRNGQELDAFIRNVYAAPDDIRKRLISIQQQ